MCFLKRIPSCIKAVVEKDKATKIREKVRLQKLVLKVIW